MNTKNDTIFYAAYKKMVRLNETLAKKLAKNRDKIKTTDCLECRRPIFFDEVSNHQSMWSLLRLDGKNVALASSHEGTDENNYATCSHCALETTRSRLVLTGSVEIGAR